MRAGRLNHKVEIHRMTETQDDTGQPVKVYTLWKYAWANVQAVTGAEKMKSGREELASVMYNLDIRFNDELRITDRIKFNGYLMDIQSMAPRGRMNRESVNVTCEVLEVNELVKA